jgi:ArsR family transcriptional regulator, arsenate/arsenite/antimonite-responsive transcriptional repressor
LPPVAANRIDIFKFIDILTAMNDPASAFKALGDPARIRILEFLWRPDAACCSLEDKVCACDVEAVLGLSQPAVSHHMKVLVQAGLVLSGKEGRWVFYRINRPRFREVAQWLGQFGKQDAAAAKKLSQNAA